MQNQNMVSTGSVYKGRTSMWLYLFHRITGVALFGYLLLHIISTALILAGPEIYEGAEAIYKNFYFRLGEVGLMAAVLAHASMKNSATMLFDKRVNDFAAGV